MTRYTRNNHLRLPTAKPVTTICFSRPLSPCGRYREYNASDKRPPNPPGSGVGEGIWAEKGPIYAFMHKLGPAQTVRLIARLNCQPLNITKQDPPYFEETLERVPTLSNFLKLSNIKNKNTRQTSRQRAIAGHLTHHPGPSLGKFHLARDLPQKGIQFEAMVWKLK